MGTQPQHQSERMGSDFCAPALSLFNQIEAKYSETLINFDFIEI